MKKPNPSEGGGGKPRVLKRDSRVAREPPLSRSALGLGHIGFFRFRRTHVNRQRQKEFKVKSTNAIRAIMTTVLGIALLIGLVSAAGAEDGRIIARVSLEGEASRAI